MNFFIFILFLTFASCTLGIQISNDIDNKFCFKFTWPGSLVDDQTQTNCSALKEVGIPCSEPIEINVAALPNLTEIWLDKDKRKNHTCNLTKGNSCIRYTYSFDDAITNVTYFCGKMIENKKTAIQSGCFNQKIGGYNVEACACQSTGFEHGMPCNLSTKLTYSSMVLISVLLLLSSMM